MLNWLPGDPEPPVPATIMRLTTQAAEVLLREVEKGNEIQVTCPHDHLQPSISFPYEIGQKLLACYTRSPSFDTGTMCLTETLPMTQKL